MKNLLLFTFLFVTLFSFGQSSVIEKKAKLEIRLSNSDNQMQRITNEHKEERIDLKKESI